MLAAEEDSTATPDLRVPRRSTLRGGVIPPREVQPFLTEAPAEQSPPFDVAATAEMSQGTTLALADACVVLADATEPMASREIQLEQGANEGLLVVPHAVDEVVVLSQTRDLQETTLDQCHCLLAPVVHCSVGFAREASRGHRPRFAALPWLGDDRVADLARITTVERAVVFNRPLAGAPRTTQERLDFGEAVGAFLARPALPDVVVEVLRPFAKKMKLRAGKASNEGRCVDVLREVRVEGDPDLEAASLALTVLLVLDERDLPTLPTGMGPEDSRVDAIIQRGIEVACQEILTTDSDVARREAWMALGELWLQPAVEAAEAEPAVGSVHIEIERGRADVRPKPPQPGPGPPLSQHPRGVVPVR